MPKRIYTSLPEGYPVCEHTDCPNAENCLHQIAYHAMLEKTKYLKLINPTHCTKDEACTFYRDNRPTTYARGFTNMQKHMFPQQYQQFMDILMGKFRRNPYFERRRGKTPLPPQEQKFILDTLKKVGVSEKLEFDSYEENINWYD